MTLVELTNAYLSANIELIAAATALVGLQAVNGRLTRPFAHRDLLRVGYLLALALVLPFAIGFAHAPLAALPHLAEVWSGATMATASPISAETQRIVIMLLGTPTSVSLQAAGRVAIAAFLSGLAFWVLRLIVDMRATAKILGAAHTMRRQKRVRIVVSEMTAVPCSIWMPRASVIVIPYELLGHREDLRLAIRHEAEHHRQHHTSRIYPLRLLQGLFFWNPVVHILIRRILLLQELACDEAITESTPGSGEVYAQCLIRLAEKSIPRRGVPRLRAGMAAETHSALMTRIGAILKAPLVRQNRRMANLVSLSAAAICIVVATLSSAGIEDRRIGQTSARRMAEIAQRDTAFPIVLNDRVIEQLNRLLATPDGRASTEVGLRDMKQYEALISEQLQRRALPSELLAVPFVESRFRNLRFPGSSDHGSGLWMFIERTAVRYGLNVSPSSDQRLDVDASTAAALEMLGDLSDQFEDWDLALLAYSVGPSEVKRRIQETGQADGWAITATSTDRGTDYLASIMAAILIIKNPASLEAG